jgi:hypothetical protein
VKLFQGHKWNYRVRDPQFWSLTNKEFTHTIVVTEKTQYEITVRFGSLLTASSVDVSKIFFFGDFVVNVTHVLPETLKMSTKLSAYYLYIKVVVHHISSKTDPQISERGGGSPLILVFEKKGVFHN